MCLIGHMTNFISTIVCLFHARVWIVWIYDPIWTSGLMHRNNHFMLSRSGPIEHLSSFIGFIQFIARSRYGEEKTKKREKERKAVKHIDKLNPN